MMHGRNNGKKLMAVRIVDHAFEIVSDHSPTEPCSTRRKFNNATTTETGHAPHGELDSEWDLFK